MLVTFIAFIYSRFTIHDLPPLGRASAPARKSDFASSREA
jgi:hypothetical protein